MKVTSLRELIAHEAAVANRATPLLRDDLVADALRGAASLVRGQRRAILEANAADCDAAATVNLPDKINEYRAHRVSLPFFERGDGPAPSD